MSDITGSARKGREDAARSVHPDAKILDQSRICIERRCSHSRGYREWNEKTVTRGLITCHCAVVWIAKMNIIYNNHCIKIHETFPLGIHSRFPPQACSKNHYSCGNLCFKFNIALSTKCRFDGPEVNWLSVALTLSHHHHHHHHHDSRLYSASRCVLSRFRPYVGVILA